MPVTLAEAMRGALTDYDASVINEFRGNDLLDLMVFDDVVNPVGGGATLTYGYRRQLTLSTAAFRAINSEYTPSEGTTETKSVDLKPLGGSYQIDRVLAKVGGAAAAGEVARQTTLKIKAAQNLFGDTAINGDSAVDANSFDGLSKALVGSSTESTAAFDLTGTRDQAWAFRVLEMLDDLIGMMDGQPTAILGNTKLVNIVKSAVRLGGAYVLDPTQDRARYAVRYGSAAIIDAGFKQNGTTAVIPVNVADPDGAGPLVAGSTALYAVRIALDGFHGVSIAGGNIVESFPPDFTTAGAVKTGEVELGPVAVALKATRAAAVLRNVKVQ